jgi:hypothetical protein
MVSQRKWQELFLDRFSDREDLGESAVRRLFWDDLPVDEVKMLFAFLKAEFTLQPGLLRPTDPASLFSRSLRGRRLFGWMLAQARFADASSELNTELARRIGLHGLQREWVSIETVDDIVRAWCGMRPAQSRARVTTS